MTVCRFIRWICKGRTGLCQSDVQFRSGDGARLPQQ